MATHTLNLNLKEDGGGFIESDNSHPSPEINLLPSRDGGKHAWLFLVGACIVEITAWGKLKYPTS